MRTSRLRLAAGPLHLLLWPLLRPEITGLRILRVLNREVLAPGASFRARTYPKVDILNLILEGEAEYRDSDGNHVQAKAGEALLIATQPGVSYSEHNLSKEQSLTRMQLWLDACPQRENPLQQKINVADATLQLLASPEGGDNSLQLRQQAGSTISRWRKVSRSTCNYMVHAPTCSRFWLRPCRRTGTAKQALTCGDGAFIRDEANITLVADTPLRALLIDLPV